MPKVMVEIDTDTHVVVPKGALHMVVNALRRDAAEGKHTRGEMADELLNCPQPEQAQQSDIEFPSPYALIEIDVDHGVSVVEMPSHKTVEVFSRKQVMSMLAAQQPTARPIPTSERLPDFLYEIGERIRTQDNRITADPIFAVQKLVKDIVPEGYEDSYEWCETESGDYCIADKRTAARLDLLHEDGRDTGKWQKFFYRERWEFVTACFTEAGANEHIRLNGHNIGKARVYAYSAFRNPEMIELRQWLIGLAMPPAPGGSDE